MARRQGYPYYGKEYLGNTNTNQVHDLDKEDISENGCQIDEIKHEHIKMYDYHFQAKDDGFEDCDKCLK